jgi:hypothetical protein
MHQLASFSFNLVCHITISSSTVYFQLSMWFIEKLVAEDIPALQKNLDFGLLDSSQLTIAEVVGSNPHPIHFFILVNNGITSPLFFSWCRIENAGQENKHQLEQKLASCENIAVIHTSICLIA